MPGAWYRQWIPDVQRYPVERGWCLIDDPYDSGRYFVTHKKDLTKKQKDFLYGYFLDMGMKKRAEEFVRDDA